MMTMVYVEVELKRKVDWRTIFTRNKEDIMEYATGDIPGNFSFFQQNVGNGSIPNVCGIDRNTLQSKKSVRIADFMRKAICFDKNKSRSEDEEGSNVLRKLDSTMPKLEGDIQDIGSIGGRNLNLND